MSNGILDLNFATDFLSPRGKPLVDATVYVGNITTEFRGKLATLPWHIVVRVAHFGTPWRIATVPMARTVFICPK